MSEPFELPLRGTDLVAVIDAADVELVLSQRASWKLNGRGYVVAQVPHPTGALRTDGIRVRRYSLGLHRLILGLEYGDPRLADHEDRNPLNNRRSNLRLATDALNAQNQTPQIGRSSIHRGVAWHKAARKWEAHGKLDGRKVYLGLFIDELDAAAASREWRQVNLPFSSEVAGV